MDRLWLFAETKQVFLVPDAESIVDADGAPDKSAGKYELKPENADAFGRECARASQIVLVPGLAQFDGAYLAQIPSNLPRIALIKSNATEDLRSQLEGLELDAFVFSPFSSESVNTSIKKCFEDKQAVLALREELKSYSELAFTAMSSASEMGVVAFYAQAVQNTATLERLAQQTLRCLSDLSVQGFIQFVFDDLVQVYPQDASRSYRELLEWTRTSPHRIVSQGRFLIFNFDNAQLLVVDAPVDNPDKYGRLRDVIAHIASIAEARAKTIQVNELLKVQQENTRMVIKLLEMASRDNRTAVRTIMTELSLALRELATGLDLTLVQETAMLRLSEHALVSLERLHEATDAVEDHFRSLLLHLDKAAKLLDTVEPNDRETADTNVELF